MVGRLSPIGPAAMLKALEEMMPGEFVRIDAEHERIQRLLINAVHLRQIP